MAKYSDICALITAGVLTGALIPQDAVGFSIALFMEVQPRNTTGTSRSEERRVGKECPV